MANKARESVWKLPNWKEILGVLGISILSAIFFSNGKALSNWNVFLIGTFWSSLVWFSQWYGNGFIIYLLDRKWPWLAFPIWRLIVGFLSIVVYSLSAILIVNICFYYFIYGGLPEQFMAWVTFNGKIAVSISLIISTIMTSIGFFRAWKRTSIMEEQLKVEMLDYRYKTLLNQVNPHFLFNSLNVLISLVHEDQDLAEKFIRQLSLIYRDTLENRERDLVSLKEEKAFIDSYIFLLKIRFEEALDVTIDVPEDEDRFALPMASQIIIENAIKHNNVSVHKPLILAIYCEDGRLVIRNTRQVQQLKEASTGFGLDNIRKRLGFLTDEKLEIEENESEYIVKLPLLTIAK
jgi:sensor histidine kinase YesM